MFYVLIFVFYGGGSQSEREGVEGDVLVGREGEKLHFPVACCPSYTTCTASTRPVFDSLDREIETRVTLLV